MLKRKGLPEYRSRLRRLQFQTWVDQEEVAKSHMEPKMPTKIALQLSKMSISCLGFTLLQSHSVFSRLCASLVGHTIAETSLVAGAAKGSAVEEEVPDHKFIHFTPAQCNFILQPPLNLESFEAPAFEAPLSPENLGGSLTLLFADTIQSEILSKSSDISHLLSTVELGVSLKLTNDEISNALACCSLKLVSMMEKDSDGFFTTQSNEILQSVSKLFFLCSKLKTSRCFGGFDGQYYERRIGTYLSCFNSASLREYVCNAGADMFIECINAVLAHPDQVGLDEVENLKGFLTTSAQYSNIDESKLQNLVSKLFDLQIDQLKEKTRLSDGLSHRRILYSKGLHMRLLKAVRLLDWNVANFESTVEANFLPDLEAALKVFPLLTSSHELLTIHFEFL